MYGVVNHGKSPSSVRWGCSEWSSHVCVGVICVIVDYFVLWKFVVYVHGVYTISIWNTSCYKLFHMPLMYRCIYDQEEWPHMVHILYLTSFKRPFLLVPNWVTYLDWTPFLNLYVIRRGSNNNYQIYISSKEIGYYIIWWLF